MAVFPVIVKGQREAAKLNNVMPEMSKLTTRMNEAKQSGNKFECKVSLVFPHHNLDLCVCAYLKTPAATCHELFVCMFQLPKPTLN